MSKEGIDQLIQWMDTGTEYQETLQDGRERFLYKRSRCMSCPNEIATRVDRTCLKQASLTGHVALIRMPDEFDDSCPCTSPGKCVLGTAAFWVRLLQSYEA